LQGKTIGLVLSGGGARGIAHLGLLKALHEHEVPIDYIGGTSMGAFVAGLYAKHRDWKKVYDLVLDYSNRFTKWALVKDLTVPMTAWCSGASFNTLIRTSGFDDTQIEDYPIPFFCTTTNITTSKLEVHTEGTAWRYVRASMSLTYYIPPICDGPNLLVDGGYINNLPADVMHEKGANTVIACDIGGEFDRKFTDYGDSLSGVWLLWKKLNWFASPVHIPSMSDINAHLAYISCDQQLAQVRQSRMMDLYVTPAVGQYGTLQWAAFHEIYNIGEAHARAEVRRWLEAKQPKQVSHSQS
jgi:lysophospholipid hydrolase